MSIAIVLYSNGRSGSNLATFLLARHLARLGHEVAVLFQERLYSADIGFFDPAPPFSVGFLDDWPGRAEPWDVVMTTWWTCAYQAFHRLPARCYTFFRHGREKTLYDAHGRFFDAVIDAVLAEDLLVFCVNTDLKKEMEEMGRSAILVRNGVDYAGFASAVPSLPPKRRRLRVVVEGPLDNPNKRVRETLSVVGANPDVEVVHLAASGASPTDLRIDHSCLGVPYREVPGVLASCDLIVKMSATESWSMPVLETFAAKGTAIVGAFARQHDYIVDDGNALVVAPDDWDGVGAALERLLGDAALLARLREAAAATAARLSWDEPFATAEAAFLQAIAERPRNLVAATPLLDRYRACHASIKGLWRWAASSELATMREALAAERVRADAAEAACRTMRESTSWRATAPLRALGGLIRRRA